VPCYINVDNKSYLDGVEISREEFYKNLPDWKIPPTTSAPSIETFIQVFRKLIREGAKGIISIHVASQLSNIHNVAYLAAEAIKERPVKVIDSGQLTLGLGFMVLAAVKAVEMGHTLTTIVELILEKVSHVTTIAALDTVEFLKRSGRLSYLKAELASLLDIKPILKINKGIASIELARTSRKAIERLINVIQNLGPLEYLDTVHVNAQERALKLQEQVRHLFPLGVPVYNAEVTPAIGSHIGPGAVGFVYVTE